MKTRSCVPNGRGHPSRSQLLIGLLRVDSKKSVQEKNAHVKQKKLPKASWGVPMFWSVALIGLVFEISPEYSLSKEIENIFQKSELYINS